jgi:hypothetical protein
MPNALNFDIENLDGLYLSTPRPKMTRWREKVHSGVMPGRIPVIRADAFTHGRDKRRTLETGLLAEADERILPHVWARPRMGCGNYKMCLDRAPGH